MVKELDDPHPLLVDHVGVDLWRAATAWKKKLHDEMVALGHVWYADARSAVAASLDPRGLPQSVLVARMGMTKQAVQQLLDGLEADGIVRRVPDPSDGRGKRVEYTEKGIAALRDAVRIKRRMGRELKDRLGARSFDELRRTLRAAAEEWGG